MKTNYHTHTTFCDGKNTPKENAEEALKKGFDILGFSAHSLYPHSSDWHMPVEEHKNYFDSIRALAKEYDVRQGACSQNLHRQRQQVLKHYSYRLFLQGRFLSKRKQKLQNYQIYAPYKKNPSRANQEGINQTNCCLFFRRSNRNNNILCWVKNGNFVAKV